MLEVLIIDLDGEKAKKKNHRYPSSSSIFPKRKIFRHYSRFMDVFSKFNRFFFLKKTNDALKQQKTNGISVC